MHAVGLLDLDVGQSGGLERFGELVAGQSAGDAAGVGGHVRAGSVVHVGIGDHVRDREPAAWLEHASGFAQDLVLVAGQVDHAVGDDHVHALSRKRDLRSGREATGR